MEVAYISLITALLYSRKNYELLILAAAYCINLLVTVPDLYLVLVPCLVNTTHEDKYYGPSATSVSVTKAGLAGTDQRDGIGRTMGRGLSESRVSV
jgi:hypothetical protein